MRLTAVPLRPFGSSELYRWLYRRRFAWSLLENAGLGSLARGWRPPLAGRAGCSHARDAVGAAANEGRGEGFGGTPKPTRGTRAPPPAGKSESRDPKFEREARVSVARTSSLLCRRLPAGPAGEKSGRRVERKPGRLEIRDTAGWKPALRVGSARARRFLGP